MKKLLILLFVFIAAAVAFVTKGSEQSKPKNDKITTEYCIYANTAHLQDPCWNPPDVNYVVSNYTLVRCQPNPFSQSELEEISSQHCTEDDIICFVVVQFEDGVPVAIVSVHCGYWNE